MADCLSCTVTVWQRGSSSGAEAVPPPLWEEQFVWYLPADACRSEDVAASARIMTRVRMWLRDRGVVLTTHIVVLVWALDPAVSDDSA